MKKYWTYEECKAEALKYKTRKETKDNNPSLYQKIYREKWDELYSHMEIIGNKYKRLIYVYEFPDNYCYIGLTGNIKRRNRQHTQEEGNVFNYIQETGLEPTLILKTDYIDVNEASILEGKIEQEYKDNGWNILNKHKTGGLGGNQIRWTYEACKIEALKYNKLEAITKDDKTILLDRVKYLQDQRDKYTEDLINKNK